MTPYGVKIGSCSGKLITKSMLSNYETGPCGIILGTILQEILNIDLW